MKQRYLYSLIFGIPGVLISAFVALLAGGVTAGLFWIFIFGDNVWPFWAEWIIAAITVIAFITALSFIARIGFFVGKKREIENTPINNKHIIISVTTLVLLVFLMVIYQRGYIFKEPPSKVCKDICVQKGYDGISTSLGRTVSGKNTCSCWNKATKKYDEVGSIGETENQQSDFIIIKIPIIEYKVPGNILSEPIIKGYSQKIIRKNDEFIIDPATLGYNMEHSVGDIKLRLVDILQDSIVVDVLANEQFNGNFYPLDEIERRSIKNGGCLGAFPLVMDVYYEYCFELNESDSQMTLKYKIEGKSTMPLP